MITTTDELSTRLQDFARDIENIVRRQIADELLATYGNAPAPRPVASDRHTKTAAKRKGPTTPAAIDQVIAVVRKHPGLRTEQITREVGFHAKAALALLRADKKVITHGSRRTTSYTIAGR